MFNFLPPQSGTLDALHERADHLRKIHVGTCAWSFEDWRGVFFPPQLPPVQRLEFYSRYLDSVEIDSTFYAIPSAHTAANWLDSTPDNFVFAAKMPREITHDRKLRQCEEVLEEFLAGLAPLRSKLSCVLIQLPPYFTLKNDELALRSFVSRLPADFRFAVEFRDPSWHLPRVVHLLENRSLAWVWNDCTPLEQSLEGAFEFFPRTTDFLYVRLLGDLKTKYGANGSRVHRYQSLLWPRGESLDSWVARINQELPNVNRALIYANNHFEGFSPHTCQRVAARFGLEVAMPSAGELSGRSAGDDRQQQLDLL